MTQKKKKPAASKTPKKTMTPTPAKRLIDLLDKYARALDTLHDRVEMLETAIVVSPKIWAEWHRQVTR